jgi:hypothetical protein
MYTNGEITIVKNTNTNDQCQNKNAIQEKIHSDDAKTHHRLQIDREKWIYKLCFDFDNMATKLTRITINQISLTSPQQFVVPIEFLLAKDPTVRNCQRQNPTKAILRPRILTSNKNGKRIPKCTQNNKKRKDKMKKKT